MSSRKNLKTQRLDRDESSEGADPGKMGRGRAKAKQTKVARDLKYRSYSTDFASLERELRGESGEDFAEVEEELDPYEELADRYADPDSDDDSYSPQAR